MKYHVEVFDPQTINGMQNVEIDSERGRVRAWTQHNTTQHNTTQHNTTQHNTQQTLSFTVLPKEGLKISNIKQVFVLNSELTSDLWMYKSDQALEN